MLVRVWTIVLEIESVRVKEFENESVGERESKIEECEKERVIEKECVRLRGRRSSDEFMIKLFSLRLCL